MHRSETRTVNASKHRISGHRCADAVEERPQAPFSEHARACLFKGQVAFPCMVLDGGEPIKRDAVAGWWGNPGCSDARRHDQNNNSKDDNNNNNNAIPCAGQIAHRKRRQFFAVAGADVPLPSVNDVGHRLLKHVRERKVAAVG